MTPITPQANFSDTPLSRFEFETLIADALAAILGSDRSRIEAVVQETLERAREFFDVDRLVLLALGEDQESVSVRAEAYSTGASPISSGRLPPWSGRQLVQKHAAVRISRLSELPPEADAEREIWLQAPIQASLTIPIHTSGVVRHLVTLHEANRECEWPDAFVTHLRILGKFVVCALERQTMLERLSEAEERAALAADSAEAGLWSLDLETNRFWLSEKSRELYGYAPDQIITLSDFERSIHPEDAALVRPAIESARLHGDQVDIEYRIGQPHGTVRWMVSRGRPHRAPDGTFDRLMGVTIEVTEHKRALEALRTSENRLSFAVDLAGLAFYEVDFVAGTSYVDDRFRALLGLSPQLKGHELQFWMDHLHPDDLARVMELREEMHSGQKEAASVEYRIMHPEEGEKWLHHMSRIAARDAAGRAIKAHGVLRDITSRKRADEALRQSYLEIKRLTERLQAEGEYLKAEIRLTRRYEEVTGESPAMRKALRMVEQVAPTSSTVLLCGETGTGKEVISQAIHRLSPRGNRVMVKVNCAALPSGLVESELFGRERGAFTGALTRQVGRFEIADGSTLFLDEVGELPLELQAKLLRVLETGEFERLGSPKTIKVNVRLIAATNRDLPEMVRQGKFREDLYYRLSVFPIHLPPLRDRIEDIPLLVWTFLEEFSSRMGKKITQVPKKTMEALLQHPWPGNVRELRNVIEHGAIISTGDVLRITMLGGSRAPVQPSPRTLADMERQHILTTLEQTAWRIKGLQGAAAILGVKAGTLYSRMKKLGIQLQRQPVANRAE